MTEQLAQLLGFGQEAILLAGMLFVRIAAIVAFLPALGEQMIPARVRLAIALVLTVMVLPIVPPGPLSNIEASALLFLFFSELFVGLIFGITLRLLAFALMITGSIAAQATSLSQLFGAGPANEPLPAMGNLIYMAGLGLLVLLDLHIKIVSSVVNFYDALPIGILLDPLEVLTWGVGTVAEVFAFAFVLSAPFVLVSLLYNVAMGVINKAMPQLMVAFVGAPAITAGGLLLLLISMPILLPVWHTRFEAVLASPLQVAP